MKECRPRVVWARRTSRESVETEDALAVPVDIGDDRRRHEEEHPPEEDRPEGRRGVDVRVSRRPRIQENHLDIEDQKGHGDEVEPHIEPLAGRAEGVHAGLVGHPLDRPVAPRPDDAREHDIPHAEPDGHERQQGDREVPLKVNGGERGRGVVHARPV